MSQEALLDLPLTRVPFVVLDVETPGLVPGLDLAHSDLEIDDEELAAISKLRDELGLGDGIVRALHAKVYTSMLVRYTEEGILDESERLNLKRLHEALRTLGWAPGD